MQEIIEITNMYILAILTSVKASYATLLFYLCLKAKIVNLYGPSLYLPPGLTSKNPKLCPHIVFICVSISK
jgi:hypothetical protein